MIKIICFFFLSSYLYAQEPKGGIYGQEQRVFRISKIIKAFQRTSTDRLEEDSIWAEVASRSLCRSSLLSLKLECLLSSAGEYCIDKYTNQEERESCKLYLDILLVNALSQESFISKRERFDILKKSKSREYLKRQLMTRYGEVATVFSMSPNFVCGLERVDCFATGIDSFCRENSDKGNLTWQACVGALVRFSIE